MAFTPSKNKKRQNSACNNGTILAFSENQRRSTFHPRRKAPFLPSKTARTAGGSGQAGAEKRQAFSPASPLAASPSAESRPQTLRLLRCSSAGHSRTSAQRPVLGLPAGTPLGCIRKAAQTADTGATAWGGLAVTAASPASAPIPTFSAADLW